MHQIIEVFPPLVGKVINLSDIPDPVFAEKMVGDGFGIEPFDDKVYSPVDGEIKLIHSAKHAITISSCHGFDILIHIGLESVNLRGEGFNMNIKVGDKVKIGQMLGSFDLDLVTQKVKSLISPVIFVDLDIESFGLSSVQQEYASLNTPIILLTKHSKVEMQKDLQESAISSKSIKIVNQQGIHARPAALLNIIARKYMEDLILVKNSGERANLKSITAILTLDLRCGDEVYIVSSNEVAIVEVYDAILAMKDAHDEVDNNEEPEIERTNNIVENNYFGITASSGITVGKLIKNVTKIFEVTENSDNPELQKSRFFKALDSVKEAIEFKLSTLGHNEAKVYKDILSAHLLIIADPQIRDDVVKLIETNKTAEFALQKVIAQSCEALLKTKNKLLIERQADLKDVENQILSSIEGGAKSVSQLLEASILVSEELVPSDIVDLDKNVVGLVSVKGGVTSHVAILAKAKGVPLIVGVNPAVLSICDERVAILDANNSHLNSLPSNDEIKRVQESSVRLAQIKKANLKVASQEAITLDNIAIDCYGNIATLEDAKGLTNSGASGIGLFRSEFVFYGKDTTPTITEQEEIYANVIKYLEGKPFTIRTLDAGGDKPLAYLKVSEELNPVLGMRGVRLSLEYKEILEEQLTAILNISKSYPNIRIMLPMVSDLSEYREIRQILLNLKHKLNINNDIPLGIMVEVPSVVLMSEIFAKEVDFFSIGTNDLSQYLLAIDRDHTKLANQIDHMHPSVLRSIETVVNGANCYLKSVSICGVMASETLAIPLLIGLGIRELSMNINTIADNKALIRKLNSKECRKVSQECLSLATASEVRELLNTKFGHLIG